MTNLERYHSSEIETLNLFGMRFDLLLHLSFGCSLCPSFCPPLPSSLLLLLSALVSDHLSNVQATL